MIDLSHCAKLFADTAKRSLKDEDMIFITAYPKTPKPTLLKSAVAAFSVYDMQSEQEGLGADIQAGQIKIQASVYVPYKNKSENGSALAEKICTAICGEFCITGINVMKTVPDDDTQCTVTRVIFTLDDEIIKE